MSRCRAGLGWACKPCASKPRTLPQADGSMAPRGHVSRQRGCLTGRDRLGPFGIQGQEPRPKNCESPKEVSKDRPKTLPKSCSVVTGSRLWCEGICDWALNQMLFQCILIHVESSHMIEYNKFIILRFWSAIIFQFRARPIFKR